MTSTINKESMKNFIGQDLIRTKPYEISNGILDYSYTDITMRLLEVRENGELVFAEYNLLQPQCRKQFPDLYEEEIKYDLPEEERIVVLKDYYNDNNWRVATEEDVIKGKATAVLLTLQAILMSKSNKNDVLGDICEGGGLRDICGSMISMSSLIDHSLFIPDIHKMHRIESPIATQGIGMSFDGLLRHTLKTSELISNVLEKLNKEELIQKKSNIGIIGCAGEGHSDLFKLYLGELGTGLEDEKRKIIIIDDLSAGIPSMSDTPLLKPVETLNFEDFKYKFENEAKNKQFLGKNDWKQRRFDSNNKTNNKLKSNKRGR